MSLPSSLGLLLTGNIKSRGVSEFEWLCIVTLQLSFREV